MQFNLVNHGDQSNLTVFVNGVMYVADNNHPNWTSILSATLAEDESVAGLFDSAKAVETKFAQLTDRVSVRGNSVYFDGDPISGVLVDQILSFLSEGLEFEPLLNFLENVQQNPQSESRDALYAWLHATGGFGITEDGLIVGYKGVYRDGDGYVSVNSGYGIVDGVEYKNARLPNNPGSYVTMPRSQVAFDRSVGCSTGLHIGTWDYASSFAEVVLKVLVNPRDVVSVPYDSGAQKIRACAYTVVDAVTEKDENLLDSNPLSEDDEVNEDDLYEETEFEVGDRVIGIRSRERGEVTEAVVKDGVEYLAVDFDNGNAQFYPPTGQDGGGRWKADLFEFEEDDELDDEYKDEYDEDDDEEEDDYNPDCLYGQPGCDCAL